MIGSTIRDHLAFIANKNDLLHREAVEVNLIQFSVAAIDAVRSSAGNVAAIRGQNAQLHLDTSGS